MRTRRHYRLQPAARISFFFLFFLSALLLSFLSRFISRRTCAEVFEPQPGQLHASSRYVKCRRTDIFLRVFVFSEERIPHAHSFFCLAVLLSDILLFFLRFYHESGEADH